MRIGLRDSWPALAFLVGRGLSMVENCVFTAFLTILATACAILIPSREGVLATLYLVPWVVEPILAFGVFATPALSVLQPLVPYLPFRALGDIVDVEPMGSFASTPHLSWTTAVAYLGLASFVLMIASALVVRFRDPRSG